MDYKVEMKLKVMEGLGISYYVPVRVYRVENGKEIELDMGW